MSHVLNNQEERFGRGPTAEETQNIPMFTNLLHQVYFVQKLSSLLFAGIFFLTKDICICDDCAACTTYVQ